MDSRFTFPSFSQWRNLQISREKGFPNPVSPLPSGKCESNMNRETNVTKNVPLGNTKNMSLCALRFSLYFTLDTWVTLQSDTEIAEDGCLLHAVSANALMLMSARMCAVRLQRTFPCVVGSSRTDRRTSVCLIFCMRLQHIGFIYYTRRYEISIRETS